MQGWERAPEDHRVAHEPPAGEHDRRHDQRRRLDGAELPPKAHDDQRQEQQRQEPHGFLGQRGEGDGYPGTERKARREHVALHHDDPGEHEQSAGEPGEVVVVDRTCQVLRLGEECHQGGGANRERRPAREEAPGHGVDGEDREHAEDHREQPHQAWIVPRSLRDDRTQEVVEGRLLTFGLACRRQPEVVRDAVDVVEVRQLVGRRPDRGDARVRDGEAGEDHDERPEQEAIHVVPLGTRDEADGAHGRVRAVSARTHTVSG